MWESMPLGPCIASVSATVATPFMCPLCQFQWQSLHPQLRWPDCNKIGLFPPPLAGHTGRTLRHRCELREEHYCSYQVQYVPVKSCRDLTVNLAARRGGGAAPEGVSVALRSGLCSVVLHSEGWATSVNSGGSGESAEALSWRVSTEMFPSHVSGSQVFSTRE